MSRWRVLLVGIVCIAYAPPFTAAHGDSSCLYVNEEGEITQVKNAQQVPYKLRSRVVCKDTQPQDIAAPEDVKLGNDSRTASFSTELGPMSVRWSRSIERCFSTSPSRAVGEAAIAVNRALKTGRFTSDIKTARRDWSLVFTDKATAFSQFPIALSLGKHAGFMIPPSRIYIISDFVAPDCSSHAAANETLIQVLLHEMGHVVEYLMLGEKRMDGDRERAEGFAAWFEQYSAEYTSAIPAGKVRRYYADLASQALHHGAGGAFSGTAEDYAYAALQFQAIVDRRGIAGLMQVYEVMREDELSFPDAILKALSWNRATLQREMREMSSRE